MDQNNEPKWQLISEQGSIVEFNFQFSKFARILEEQNIEEPVNVSVNEELLQFIKRFCQSHNYDKEQIWVKKPIISNKLEDNVDLITLNLLNPYKGVQNAEKLSPLISASYFLGFTELQECCLAALACDFYVGNTEEDLVRYRKQHNLADLTPEEELNIMLEYEGVFQKVNEAIKQQYEEELLLHEQQQQNQQQL